MCLWIIMEIIRKHPRTKRNSNLQPLHRRSPRTCLNVNGCRGQNTGKATWNPGNGIRLKMGSRVCGMLCGAGCCNINEVTYLQEEVKREEQYFLRVICVKRKTPNGQATLSLCKFVPELWWSYVKFVNLIYSLLQPTEFNVFHIWVSHSSVPKERCHLECDAVKLCYYLPTFWSNTLPSSWVAKE